MDVSDLKGLFAEVKKRMDAQIEFVRKELAGVRTGRASTGLLENVHVEAYGAKMALNQVATLSIPEPALIVAQPFDPSLMAALERAIRLSDLGLNPASDGKVLGTFGTYYRDLRQPTTGEVTAVRALAAAASRALESAGNKP